MAARINIAKRPIDIGLSIGHVKGIKDPLRRQILERAMEVAPAMAERITAIAPNVMSIDGLGATVNMDSIDAISEVVNEANESYFYIYINGSKIKVTEGNESDAIALRMAAVNAWRDYCLYKSGSIHEGDRLVYGTKVTTESSGEDNTGEEGTSTAQ